MLIRCITFRCQIGLVFPYTPSDLVRAWPGGSVAVVVATSFASGRSNRRTLSVRGTTVSVSNTTPMRRPRQRGRDVSAEGGKAWQRTSSR